MGARGGALVCYFLLLAFATRVSFIRGLEYRPDIATLRCYADPSSSQVREGRQLLLWVGDEYLASSLENERILSVKARWVGACIAALFGEGACLAVAALATLLL